MVAENTDVNLNGGDGIDTISVATDSNFSGDTFTGFEKAVITVDDKDITVDLADVADFTSVTGVSGGNTELFKVVGTTSADTIDMSGITFTDANVSVDLDAGADTITVGTAVTAVSLGGSDTAIDSVALTATSGVVTVTEYEKDYDTINLDALTDATSVTDAVAGTATTAITATDGMVIFLAADFSEDMGDIDSTLATALSGEAAFADSTATAYIVATDTDADGTDDTAVYKWVDAGSNEIVEGELTLLGTFSDDILIADIILS